MTIHRAELEALLARRVRVHSLASDDVIMGEGEVVAICFAPTITVRAADGTLSHHSTDLPIDVQEWRRL